jgi:hypothetical protein
MQSKILFYITNNKTKTNFTTHPEYILMTMPFQPCNNFQNKHTHEDFSLLFLIVVTLYLLLKGNPSSHLLGFLPGTSWAQYKDDVNYIGQK